MSHLGDVTISSKAEWDIDAPNGEGGRAGRR